MDGEVVALDGAGRPDFGLLQERISLGRTGRPVPLVFQAFDLLYLDGRSLLDVPLEQRKRLLELVIRPTARVQVAPAIQTEGIAFFEAAKTQALEGIVAKHRRSRYEPGRRASTWLKIKARPEQELVVGGWTPGEGKAEELGALVVGVYDGERLRFAGKVGSGFDGRTRKGLRARLEALEADAPPFDPAPPQDYRGRWGGDLSGVRWVRPELVIRAEIGGWSRDGIARQTAYKGIEPGRDPREVLRERAVDPARAGRDAGATLVAPAAGASVAMPSRSSAPGTTDPDPSWLVSDAELDALARLGTEGTWHVAGQDLRLTNLDKVLFPRRDGVDEEPVTKRELIAYFARIAPVMLPHLGDRPLNLQRFPNGSGAPGFWQKDIPSSAPRWLTIWHETGLREREDRAPNDHLVADRAATLCWLGNQAAFEIHAWTSVLGDPWTPTYALIDIDPGTSTTWAETLTLARLFRAALEHLGVRAYPKLTGSRGIQAWIPIERGRYTYADTSSWIEKLSRAVGATVPDLVSWEWAKAERGGGRASTTRRTRRSRRSSPRTPSARDPVRPCPRRSAGRSWTRPTWHRIAGPSATSGNGSRPRATRGQGCRTTGRSCRCCRRTSGQRACPHAGPCRRPPARRRIPGIATRRCYRCAGRREECEAPVPDADVPAGAGAGLNQRTRRTG